MNVKGKIISVKYSVDPWLEFDAYWNLCQIELMRSAHSCKGFLTGETEPFIIDEISKELAHKLDEQMIELIFKNALY